MDIFALAALKKANIAISEIEGIGNVITFKGVVDSSSNLPLSNNKKGDLYIVSGDGSEWIWVSDSSSGTISDYEQLGTVAKLPAELGFGYATCSTAGATGTKTASLSNYELTTGGIVSVKFTNSVPAYATLNINSKGAKAIYYKGAAITDGVIKAGDTATFIYSTYYHLISIDRAVERPSPSNDTPSTISIYSGSAGSSIDFSKADHTHQLLASDLNAVLKEVGASGAYIILPYGGASDGATCTVMLTNTAQEVMIDAVSARHSACAFVVPLLDDFQIVAIGSISSFGYNEDNPSNCDMEASAIADGKLYSSKFTLAWSDMQTYSTISVTDLSKPKYTTLTLATSDWSAVTGGYSCNKTVSGMTATSIVWLSYSDTETEFTEAQSTDTLTFTVAALPTAAIMVNVAFAEGSALS